MKKKTRTLIIIGALIVAAAIAAVIIIRSNRTRFAVNTSKVEQATVELTVMATGYIQPVEEIEVGTQVSGVIEKIYVDYNSHVTKGQLLAELDKSTLQEKVVQAEASLNSAQSELLYAQQNYDRVKNLFDAKAATQVNLEQAVNTLNQAKTTLDNARANMNQAEVNLSYAVIYSPIDGVVLDRSVNTGQTVAASFNTPTLFTIAEDLTKMQVEVDVDEADIGQLRVGQKAQFTVDAYNGEYFEGTVNQIRLQPTVTNNVVTYTVIVEAPNPDEKLFPGMTANITITVSSEEGLTVPMEALSFRMTPEIAKKINVPQSSIPVGASSSRRSSQSVDGPSGATSVSDDLRNVWVRKGDTYEVRQVRIGIDDGIDAIVRSGLSENEEVILSVQEVKNGKDSQAVSIMPNPRRR